MPTVTFEVTVSVSDEVGDSGERGRVSADASRYLAYADHTDLFGYHGFIENVHCNRKHNYAYESATITFAAPVGHEEEIDRFLSEMEALARVEDAKCITNPVDQ